MPDRLDISVASMTLAASMGATCWCMSTMGFRAYGQPELVFILTCHTNVWPPSSSAAPFLSILPQAEMTTAWCTQDEVFPQDLATFVKHLYKAVANGFQLSHGQTITVWQCWSLPPPRLPGAEFAGVRGVPIWCLPCSWACRRNNRLWAPRTWVA